jgi:hypothetical protein
MSGKGEWLLLIWGVIQLAAYGYALWVNRYKFGLIKEKDKKNGSL